MQQYRLCPAYSTSGFGRNQIALKVKKHLIGPAEKETIKNGIRASINRWGPITHEAAKRLAVQYKRLPATILKFAAEVENE